MVKETFKNNKNQILISLISILLSITTVIAYTFLEPENDVLMYLEVLGVAIVPLTICIALSLLKLDISNQLIIAIVIFAYCACDIGTCYGLYVKTTYWDLFMHGSFGILATFFLEEYLIKKEDCSSYIKFFIIMVLCVLGVAACWEILEYSSDCIIHGDAQKVYASMAAGKSPVSDTMEDIIITGVTSSLTLIIEYIVLKASEKRKIVENENSQNIDK